MSDSINILKNDYEKKVNDVQKKLDDFIDETRASRQESDRRMEEMIERKIRDLNDNLLDQMSKMHQSTMNNENVLMKKIADMENNIKQINENFENMSQHIEDVQEKMYDFEQNKKNNLIFYGVPGGARETKDDLKNKISSLLKLRLNIRREISILRASRMLTGPQVLEIITLS